MKKQLYPPNKIKRVKKLILFSVLLLLLIPLWMWMFWFFQKDKEMNIIIIDKTVSDLSCQEHRGFNWILTYFRFVNSGGGLYNIYSDYYGFFPLEPLEKKQF
jgi:hypothetical protein